MPRKQNNTAETIQGTFCLGTERYVCKIHVAAVTMISRIPAHPHWNIVVAFCNMLPRSEICEEWAEFNSFTSKPIYSTGKSSMNEAEMCLGLHYSMTCTDHCLQHLCHSELSELLDNGADAESADWWSLWLVFLPFCDQKPGGVLQQPNSEGDTI
jgi:hypothetical protein